MPCYRVLVERSIWQVHFLRVPPRFAVFTLLDFLSQLPFNLCTMMNVTKLSDKGVLDF